MTTPRNFLAAALLMASPLPALAADATPFGGPRIGPVPVEFILFALVLGGVAMLHLHALKIAIGGALTIAVYKLLFSPFKTGAGLGGLGLHLGHEWVMLANLLLLLMGFALLAKHFEDSGVPAVLPRFLPDDWKGGFVLLLHGVRAVELSRQHRRGDDRRRRGAHGVPAAACTSATWRPSSPPPMPAAPAAWSATPPPP